MAKKRAKKEVMAKKARKSKVAFVFGFIGVLILLVNGLLVILMRNKLAEIILTYTGSMINTSALLTYGIVWLALSALIWTTLHRIEKLQLKSEKWLLLAFAVITMVSMRIESGVLVLISAIIYLAKK
ncbi:MAG: hypothetical protein V1886_00120 [archaeon]